MATEILEKTETGTALFDVRHRITVEEYHRMAEAGIFGPESRVELLEGVIVDKMTRNPPHNLACDLVQQLMSRSLPGGYFASMSASMTFIDRDGEPEPDATIRGNPRDYAGRRRTPADAALMIEASDATYHYDRFVKWVTYAGAGVPIYWIVDLNGGRLEVHTEPSGRGEAASCTRTQIFGPDDEVPLMLDGREVARFAAKEILP